MVFSSGSLALRLVALRNSVCSLEILLIDFIIVNIDDAAAQCTS